MTRAAILLSLLSACVLDPSRHKRPARMQVGATARHFAAPAGSDVAFRDSMPPPKVMTESHEAVAASLQFTQGLRHHLYLGGELEAGALDSRGSSTAAGYGVFGLDLPFAAGTVGAEVATGFRSVRYSTDTDDLTNFVVEPRLRASVWTSEQTSLAVVGGMTLDDQPVFMAGVMFGIHSNALDSFGR